MYNSRKHFNSEEKDKIIITSYNILKCDHMHIYTNNLIRAKWIKQISMDF